MNDLDRCRTCERAARTKHSISQRHDSYLAAGDMVAAVAHTGVRDTMTADGMQVYIHDDEIIKLVHIARSESSSTGVTRVGVFALH